MVVNMSMNYFAHLKLPFDLDMSELAKFDYDPNKLGYTVKDASLVDQRLIDLLASFNLKIAHIGCFYTPPHTLLPIHCDTASMQNFCKLNFAYGDEVDKARMIWYRLKDGFVPKIVRTPDHERYVSKAGDVSYVSIPSDQAIPVASAIVRTTLVNVGRPHSVINTADSARWALSLPLRDVHSNETLEFDDVHSRLKELT